MDKVRLPTCSSCPHFRAETSSLSISLGTGHPQLYRTGTNPNTAETQEMTLPSLGSLSALRQGQIKLCSYHHCSSLTGQDFSAVQSLAIVELSCKRPCTHLGTTWAHYSEGLGPLGRSPLPTPAGCAVNSISLGSYTERKSTGPKPRKVSPQHGPMVLLYPGPRQWTPAWSLSLQKRDVTYKT